MVKKLLPAMFLMLSIIICDASAALLLTGKFRQVPAYGYNENEMCPYYEDICQIGNNYYALMGSSVVIMNSSLDSIAGTRGLRNTYLMRCVMDKYSRPVVMSPDCISVKDGENWEYHTSESELPTNKLYSMARSAKGDIYITTSLGIVRYDGENFMYDSVSFDIKKGIFSHFPFNVSNIAMRGDTVFYLAEDQNLYSYFNGSLKNKYCIFQDDQKNSGTLWLLKSYNDSVYFYAEDHSRHSFRIMKYDGSVSEIIDLHKTDCPYHDSSSFKVNSFCFDSVGRLWAAVSYMNGSRYYCMVIVWDGEKWCRPAVPNNYKWIIVNDIISIGSRVFILGSNPANNEMVVYDDDPTSVEEQVINRGAIVYPNPVQSCATLSLQRDKPGFCTVYSVDILGLENKLWQGILQEGRNDVHLDLSNLATGCHNIIIEGADGIEHLKVVKK